MRIGRMLEGFAGHIASARLARALDTDDVLLIEARLRRTIVEEPVQVAPDRRELALVA